MAHSTKKIVSGILLLNKSPGMTSHSAVSQAKRLFMSADFDSKKAGHTGTLDPMATGLLPICFGEATKLSSFGLDADKTYRATIQLGRRTDTGDKEGQVIDKKDVLSFNQADLDALAKVFLGEQMQVPPMYSALKQNGKKLYELAREGITVERLPRQINIHQLILQKISGDEIKMQTTCSKGTYIRVLAESIAEKLGTVGHLTTLERIKTGGFKIDDALTLDELSALSFQQRLDVLLPVDTLVKHLPKIDLTNEQAIRVRLGQRLNSYQILNKAPTHEQLVRLYNRELFLGMARIYPEGRLQPIRILAV